MLWSNKPVNFDYVEWKHPEKLLQSSAGTMKHVGDALFDGVACDDLYKTVKMEHKRSFISVVTEPQEEEYLEFMTVEYWFKLLDDFEKTDYLLSTFS